MNPSTTTSSHPFRAPGRSTRRSPGVRLSIAPLAAAPLFSVGAWWGTLALLDTGIRFNFLGLAVMIALPVACLLAAYGRHLKIEAAGIVAAVIGFVVAAIALGFGSFVAALSVACSGGCG